MFKNNNKIGPKLNVLLTQLRIKIEWNIEQVPFKLYRGHY